MYITYVGHASVLIEMDGQVIITDPVLRDRFMMFRRHARSLDGGDIAARPVSLILLSHLHYDHADPPSLQRLPRAATVVAPHGASLFLRTRLAQEVVELGVGETFEWAGLLITATPAAHPGGRALREVPSPALGYIIEGSYTLYFAGDTDLFDEMEELGAGYAIDVAFLPVAGCSPRTPAGHLNPHSAARALRMLKARLAVPVHWGTLRPIGPMWSRMRYLQDPPNTFAGYARQLAPETEVKVLVPGETARIEGKPARFCAA